MICDPHVQLIRSPGLFGGAPYAYAAAVPNDARLLFTAGACPLDETGATVTVLGYPGRLVEVEAVAVIR